MRTCFSLLLLAFSLQVFSQKQSSVLVEVNPELELFSIVTYLSGNIKFVVPSNYERDVKKELRAFRKHPAVSEIKRLYKGHDGYIEVTHPMLAFHCSPLPELNVVYEQDDLNAAELEKYLKYLRNFADEINYKDFYNSHKAAMDSWVKPVQDTIQKYQLADKLGNLFGQHKEFRVYLDAFNSWGGQAFVPNETFTATKAYFRLGYNSYTKASGEDKPPFFNNRSMLIELIWHEGTHTYVATRIRKHLSLFDESSSLLNEQRQTELQKAGRFKWTWSGFLDEQVTRATVAYLLLKNMGEAEWQKECKKQEQIGFIYTKDISLLMEKYDTNKTTYADFSDFLPEIAKYLKNQTAKL